MFHLVIFFIAYIASFISFMSWLISRITLSMLMFPCWMNEIMLWHIICMEFCCSFFFFENMPALIKGIDMDWHFNSEAFSNINLTTFSSSFFLFWSTPHIGPVENWKNKYTQLYHCSMWPCLVQYSHICIYCSILWLKRSNKYAYRLRW